MADANIKKVTIKKSLLPPIDYDTQKYNIRYRIISEDKNRASHWSSIYNSLGSNIVVTSGAVSITSTNPKIITAVWGDENSSLTYDVFVKFDSNQFVYKGIVTGHSYSFANQGTTSVRVKIQIVSSKKEIKDSFLVYDSGVQSLI
jgi:hypothetical protein